MSTPLRRLVYRSESCVPHDDVDVLNAIFKVSVHNNMRDGITGALALPDGIFVQALEGEEDAVSALLARIRADDRHRNMVILEDGPIDARLFGGWAMARPDPTPLNEQAFRIITEVGTGSQVVGLLFNLSDTPDCLIESI